MKSHNYFINEKPASIFNTNETQTDRLPVKYLTKMSFKGSI